MTSQLQVTDIIEKLWPRLVELEKKRKKILRKTGLCAVIVLPITIASILTDPFTAIFVCIITTGLAYLWYRFYICNYISLFKHDIIREIFSQINPGLEYAPMEYVYQNDFTQSQLFSSSITDYKGEDLVQGVIKPSEAEQKQGNLGETMLKFSEICAQKTTRSSKHRHTITIFRGLFFIADFNKKLRGTTLVKPDTAENLLGRLGTFLQEVNPIERGELVQLENPEFEEHFVVYSDDQQEARYILSSQIMERIVEFKHKTQQAVYMSFRKGKVYVALSGSKDRFEPSFFRTLLRNELIEQYIIDIELVLGLVEELNLNRRIWH
jgi:hypothetical protein